MTSGSLGQVEKLSAHHALDAFESGQSPLGQFLKRFALANQRARRAQTYVVCRGANQVVGYYSLCVGAVGHAAASERVRKGLANHPVPVMIFARLIIALLEQKRGLGKALLKDALLRTVQAADIVGIRALLVHAKDDEARRRYLNFDFEESPNDPYHLFLLMKDLRAILNA